MDNELPNLPSPKATARRSRKTIRLKDYDYSQEGCYFITICTNNREETIGRITEPGKMILNDVGKMILKYWKEIPRHYENVKLDKYIIMPNHLHGIINIVGVPPVGTRMAGQNNNRYPNYSRGQNMELQAGRPQGHAPTEQRKITISDIIGSFKSITTNEYIKNVKQNNWKPFDKQIWQRNYYEHIITSDKSYNNIREYIENNPYNWEDDRNNIF